MTTTFSSVLWRMCWSSWSRSRILLETEFWYSLEKPSGSISLSATSEDDGVASSFPLLGIHQCWTVAKFLEYGDQLEGCLWTSQRCMEHGRTDHISVDLRLSWCWLAKQIRTRFSVARNLTGCLQSGAVENGDVVRLSSSLATWPRSISSEVASG